MTDMITESIKARATRDLRDAEKARRILRAHAERVAAAAADIMAAGRDLDDETIAAVGVAAINAERAERAVVIRRAEYFRAHPAA